jgi:long-chain-fatty-acyl-CoA reductase
MESPPRPLPFIVNGTRVDPVASRPTQRVSLRFGDAVLPELTDAIADTILAGDRLRLAEVPEQDILSFLNRVGRLWKNREYTRRRLFTRQLEEHLGYSAKMADAEADWIAALLTGHSRLWDQLAAELGSRFVTDEWVRREETEIRAFPRGLTVHITAGNVPTAAIASAVRGVITKNTVLLKPSADDLITSLAFALSMHDVDRHHPVTKCMTVVYWPHDHVTGRRIVGSADAVCAWGGHEAIAWAHAHTPPSAPFLPFGPKRSLAVIDGAVDPVRAAKALAHDVCMNDQRGCFSVQQVFVIGDASGVVGALGPAFERFRDLYPRGARHVDDAAWGSLTRLDDEFLGAECIDAGDAVIVQCPPRKLERHPLDRYVYVHEIESLDRVAEFLDDHVQTLCLMPWDLGRCYRNVWAARGVARITELGLNNLFRCGTSHDDLNPLALLVRFVSTELPAANFGKGMLVELDLTELLARHELADVVQ